MLSQLALIQAMLSHAHLNQDKLSNTKSSSVKLSEVQTFDFLQTTQIASYGSLTIGVDEILSNDETSNVKTAGSSVGIAFGSGNPSTMW